MAQLRERGEDLLRPRPPEFHRELRALPSSLAGHDHSLAELWMPHPHADRARSVPRPLVGALIAAAPPGERPRFCPGNAIHPLEAVLRDLAEESRPASADGIPGASKGGVEEVDPLLRASERDVEEPALLLELSWIVERRGVGKEPLLQTHDKDDRELEPLGRVDRHEVHGVLLVV